VSFVVSVDLDLADLDLAQKEQPHSHADMQHAAMHDFRNVSVGRKIYIL